MTTENVGATTGFTDVAQCQLQDARGTNHGIANGVLSLTHAPHDGAGVVFVQHLGHFENLFFFHTTSFFYFVGCPLGHDVGLDRFHAVHTVIDVLLVFPSILEDVIHDAKQKWNVGTRADANILVGLGRSACETWIDHDHLAAIFFGMQHVQHADRVRFCRIGANVQSALAVLHVVVRVGHGAVAPCIGHTRHRGGVANARLVIGVVGAPEAHKLAHQIGLLVVVLGRANEINAVGATGFAQLHHAFADFFQGQVPADALVLAIDQLHGIAQAVFAVAVFTKRCTFGAMCTQIDGRIEHRFLANPHAVFNNGVNSTTHRAVGTNCSLHFNLACTKDRAALGASLGFFHQAQLRSSQTDANP